MLCIIESTMTDDDLYRLASDMYMTTLVKDKIEQSDKKINAENVERMRQQIQDNLKKNMANNFRDLLRKDIPDKDGNLNSDLRVRPMTGVGLIPLAAYLYLRKKREERQNKENMKIKNNRK